MINGAAAGGLVAGLEPCFRRAASLSGGRTSPRTSLVSAAWGRCRAENDRLCSTSSQTSNRGHLLCPGRGLSEWFSSQTEEWRWGKPMYMFVSVFFPSSSLATFSSTDFTGATTSCWTCRWRNHCSSPLPTSRPTWGSSPLDATKPRSPCTSPSASGLATGSQPWSRRLPVVGLQRGKSSWRSSFQCTLRWWVAEFGAACQ